MAVRQGKRVRIYSRGRCSPWRRIIASPSPPAPPAISRELEHRVWNSLYVGASPQAKSPLSRDADKPRRTFPRRGFLLKGPSPAPRAGPSRYRQREKTHQDQQADQYQHEEPITHADLMFGRGLRSSKKTYTGHKSERTSFDTATGGGSMLVRGMNLASVPVPFVMAMSFSTLVFGVAAIVLSLH